MKLNKILQPVSRELLLVKEEMKNQLKNISNEQSDVFSNNKYVNQRIKHLFKSPGKLLRPALVLLSAKSVNGSGFKHHDSLIKLATVVEFIHSSSLIHDDIIDDSDYRREHTSLNKQFGNHAAVLVGDIINSQFMTMLANLEKVSYRKRIRILEIFSTTIKKMCLGEIYEQKIKRNNIIPTIKEYLEIIKNKTASLMSASCFCGAFISGAKKIECQVLENFGLYLGLSFQIADDCMDNDSIYTSRNKLIQEAERCAHMAETEINKLEQTKVKQHLINLNEYVIESAKNNVNPA